MKLVRTFEISSDEFYNYLEEHILEDIKKTTNKRVSKRDLKSGYTYSNKPADTKITIEEYERGHIYQTIAKSKTSYMRVSYVTKETKDGLEIEFEQYIKGDEKLKEKNKLYQTWHNWITFGRMSRTLYDMRTDIINLRDGIKPVKQQQPEHYKTLKKVLRKKYADK